jgi:excisionase family DNA binding protein
MNQSSAENKVQLSDWTDREGLAAHLKVSVRHIQNQERRRRVPYYRIGRRIRFRISEVEKALKVCEVTSIGQS